MKDNFLIDKPDLEKLFEKYRLAPDSLVFAPLADACRKLGRLEEAVEICGKGLKHHPDYTSGHVVLGKSLFDMGRKEEASEAFQRVLSLDPDNLVALRFMGLILTEKGELEAAAERFRHFLTLDPANEEIKAKLLGLEEREEVIELAPLDDEGFEGEEISLGGEVETSDELASTTLADIFASQGYKDRAIKIYREVLSKQPDNEAVRKRLQALEEEGISGGAPPPSGRSSEEGGGEGFEPLDGRADSGGGANEGAEAGESSPRGGEDEGPVNGGAGRTPIDGRQDVERFKRWLQNMSE